ncbi:hypothetical protein SAMN05421797_1075 [Maribacter ulvicola]|uniref:Uncharacterized protein n=1 Tax=Maribacter ulvicola TaxID=228959 RepID=A0A1N6YIN5_9FLAO|nr:hypothetical protein SAMN05421797_1075 [Maribacter ulvicola]
MLFFKMVDPNSTLLLQATNPYTIDYQKSTVSLFEVIHFQSLKLMDHACLWTIKPLSIKKPEELAPQV